MLRPLLVMTMVAVAISSCAPYHDRGANSVSDDPVDGGPEVQSTQQAINKEELAASVVGIRASGCSLVPALGSGVVIAHDRVATAAHTVAGAKQVEVAIEEGHGPPQWINGTVVGFDPDNDVALVDIAPSAWLIPRPIAETVALGPGWLGTWDPEFGVAVTDITITRRLRVTIEDIYIEEIVNRQALEFAGPVAYGDSGGPVFTADGKLAGVVYAASRERDAAGFATSAGAITALAQQASGHEIDNGRC